MTKKRAKRAKQSDRTIPTPEAQAAADANAFVALVTQIDRVAPGLSEVDVAKCIVRRGFAIVRLIRESQTCLSTAQALEELAAKVVLVRGSLASGARRNDP